MKRSEEIRQLNLMTPQQVTARAGDRLVVCDTVADLHEHLADSIFREIHRNNQAGQPTRLILPVGPTGQYPILARRLNKAGISLRDCYFFFMDEYCDEAGAALPNSHPLSFKGIAQSLFLDAITADCQLKRTQVYFPDERNTDALPALIDSLGGIDACYGGIGIHGHLAFNEPEPGVRDLPSRKVRLNDYTVTINAIRAGVGGNLAGFPRYAYTLGMREILAARRIRLYCRNGIALDWANTVLRLALFGAPGDDYPVTHIRDKDYVIVTDRDTLQSPRHLL